MWRCRRTVMQMLVDRGYNLTQEEVEKDLDTFCGEYDGRPQDNRDRINLLAYKQSSPTDRIVAFFPGEATVGTQTLKQYFEKMEEQKASAAIVVILKKISTFASKSIEQMAADPDPSKRQIMEVFLEEELLINITEHELVPSHKLLDDDAKQALLKRYKLKETQLPRLQAKDPVAKYYGLKRGQVVKIERPSETAGRYITYRLVV